MKTKDALIENLREIKKSLRETIDELNLEYRDDNVLVKHLLNDIEDDIKTTISHIETYVR